MAQDDQEDQTLQDMATAILKDDAEQLEFLLQSDPNPGERLTTFFPEGEYVGQTLLHIAADISRNKCVRVILSQVGAKEGKELCNLKEENRYGRIPLHTVLDGGCRCQECSDKNIDCVEILLESGSDVNSRDDEGDTPLVYATKHMMSECASILLERGADANIQLTFRGSRRKPTRHLVLYKYIAQKIPNALKTLLDNGITPSDKDSSILNLDFKVFLSNREKEDVEEGRRSISSNSKTTETDILVCMSTAHDRELLLTHPMTLAFLHFKWSLVRRFVFCIQLSYFIMVAIYTWFVLEAFDYIIPPDPDDDAATGSTTKIKQAPARQELPPEEEEARDRTLVILGSFVCIWWIFMTFNELYEMSLGLKAYVKVQLNFVWWILIICVGISVPPGFGADPELWQLPVAAFAVFLAWGLTLVQTSRIPSVGIYIEMLGKVVADFAVFLITFSALIIGFALAFHVLFPEDVMFSNVATSFVKVILIMIGETGYETIFDYVAEPKPDFHPDLGLEYTIPAHILFVGFIFLITIVLMNLLLGLAVSDIQELRKVATVIRVKRQIEQIQLLEMLLQSKYLPKKFSEIGLHHLSIMKILDNYDLISTTSLVFCPTDPDDKALPNDVKEKFRSYELDKLCINSVPVAQKPEDPGPQESERIHKPEKEKRMARLEEKVNQMQETLVAIHEQLAKLQQST